MKKIILAVFLLLILFDIFYNPPLSVAAAVNDGSTAILTMTFKNELGVAVTPTTVDYRLDNVSTGAMIRNWTNLISPASEMNVEISYLENTMSSTRTKETIRVTVKWTYDITKHGTAEYLYDIVNLVKIQ